MEIRGIRLKKHKISKLAKGFFVLRKSENYVVPLSVGVSEQSERVVSVGDKVNEGTLLAKPKGKYGNFVYSPCCGSVVGIVRKLNINGIICDHVIIKQENREDKSYLPTMDASEFSAEKLLKRLYESGMVDNFPPYEVTYKKYLLNSSIKQLIINCTETDPYEYATSAIVQTYTSEMFEGALLFKTLCNAENIIFVFTNKQAKTIKLFKEYLKKRGLKNKVKIKIYPHIYPLSYSRLLAYYQTGKMVKENSRTAEIKVIVEGAINCYDFFHAVYNGKPAIERAVTISGNNCLRKANYFVKNGTPINHIMEVVGFNSNSYENMLIFGGIMTGVAQETPSASITLAANSLLLCDSSEFGLEKESECINCGKCVQHCPVRIHVKNVDDAFTERDFMQAKKLGVSTCLNCGVCSFVCPAKRKLAQKVQYMKNFTENRRAKNPDSSDYLLVEGEDTTMQQDFDTILDVKGGYENVKETNEQSAALEVIESLKEKKPDSIISEGGDKNE